MAQTTYHIILSQWRDSTGPLLRCPYRPINSAFAGSHRYLMKDYIFSTWVQDNGLSVKWKHSPTVSTSKASVIPSCVHAASLFQPKNWCEQNFLPAPWQIDRCLSIATSVLWNPGHPIIDQNIAQSKRLVLAYLMGKFIRTLSVPEWNSIFPGQTTKIRGGPGISWTDSNPTVNT